MTKAYSYIRMSTDQQLKGDSLRRQKELSERFAADHGLELDTTFNLHDIGVSAFKGLNVERGQLGKFIQAAAEGLIEKGSYLLIESFDRMSRMTPGTALRLFLEILDYDIVVATMTDGQVYKKDAVDTYALMASIISMSRAHEESVVKRDRLSRSWENKRRRAGSQVMTRQTVAWVEVRPDRSGFDLVADRAEVVRRVFQDAANGIGSDRIARMLNQEGVPAFKKPESGWHKSYITKILTNRAVLGEFQPHVIRGGKRVPEGAVVPGYYPSVIDDDLFYRAQAGRRQRRTGAAGRKGEKLSNLFSGLARCGVCGDAMHYFDKGKKGRPHLFCGRARRGAGCPVRIGWSYEALEISVLSYLQEIDLPAIVASTPHRAEREAVTVEVQQLQGRLVEAETKRARILGLLIGDEPTDFLKDELRRWDDQVADLQKRLVSQRERLAVIEAEQAAFSASSDAIASAVQRLQDHASGDAYRLRSAVGSRLRDVLSEIRVFPGGRPVPDLVVQELTRLFPDRSSDELAPYVTTLSKDRRMFQLEFKNGSVRVVTPHRDDPRLLKGIGGTHEPLVTDSLVRTFLTVHHGRPDPSPDELIAAMAQLRDSPQRLEQAEGYVALARQRRTRQPPAL